MLGALFAVVFYGADFLTGLRANHLALYFDWERRMPFYGPAYAVYYSVIALPFLVPILVDDTRQIRGWRTRMAAAIVIAGAVFVLVPAKLGYPPNAENQWRPVMELTTIVAGSYNLVPSLHVALMLIIMSSLWTRVSPLAKAWLAAWGVALASSTLLTHQHHVLDVVTGLLLAVFVCMRIPAR